MASDYITGPHGELLYFPKVEHNRPFSCRGGLSKTYATKRKCKRQREERQKLALLDQCQDEMRLRVRKWVRLFRSSKAKKVSQ